MKRGPEAAIALALAALVAWSFHVRWTMLTASPFPLGVDGYFYPVELRALLETGHLAYPASPLVLWLMLPLAAITDPITGAKLGAALFGALIALPAYGVGARLARSRAAGLVAAAVATTSTGSRYMTVEFVKNSAGLTIALAALWLVLRACERPARGRIAAALVAILAAVLAHKMAAALVIALAIPAAILEAVARGKLRGRRLLQVVAVLVLAGAVALVLGTLIPERLLSPADLVLVGDLFTTTPRWLAPALASGNLELTMGYEPLLAGITGALVLATSRGDKRSPGDTAARLVAHGSAILAIVIAVPWLDVGDAQQLGFRLRVIAFVPLALCAAILVARAAAQLPRHRELATVALAAVLVVARVARTPQRLDGEVVTHPALVTGLYALSRHVPPGATLVIPERHITFMAAWYLRAPTSLTARNVAHPVRVLPLNWHGVGSPLDDALFAARAAPGIPPPVGGHPSHPNGLVLIPEATWPWLLQHEAPWGLERWGYWPTN